MTHEVRQIFEHYTIAQTKGQRAVLATVVALDGASYRKPGVRMLILDDHSMIGAVSGGCVEKDILRQSQEVFESGLAKMMTYDGRYRLGCEGILYILLEPFKPSSLLLDSFRKCLENRKPFEIISRYEKTEGKTSGLGSMIKFSNEQLFPVSENGLLNNNGQFPSLATFTQSMSACFQIIIIGAEHDAVQLCLFASSVGWDVTVVSAQDDPRQVTDFPGAKRVFALNAEELNSLSFDNQTAVIVMTHNYATDLKYLLVLRDIKSSYLGLLGPAKRKEKILSQLIEHCPEVDADYLDSIHGPAGINIGSETPQEIAISIVAEILSVIRDEEPMKLTLKIGPIHS
jgi:xanthine/CO dehydrogenase XdhC/CoxF family maturation factor